MWTRPPGGASAFARCARTLWQWPTKNMRPTKNNEKKDNLVTVDGLGRCKVEKGRCVIVTEQETRLDLSGCGMKLAIFRVLRIIWRPAAVGAIWIGAVGPNQDRGWRDAGFEDFEGSGAEASLHGNGSIKRRDELSAR